MPRRKKLPPVPDYTGLPADESKLMVQKCHPLQTLSETNMSLVEFKILDAYLAKIDSHDESKRYVRFEKGELEHILGVSRIPKDELEKRLKNLFQVVTIRDKHKKNGFTMIALFEKAEAFQDENGLWQIDLACTPSAMEYVFNVDVLGYLPYILKNIIELTSRYSYILYLYLENRRQSRLPNTWTVPLDELKTMLRCNADTYSEYFRFNGLVLKKCFQELNAKTSIRYTYEPVKRGRTVVAIRFTLESLVLPDTETPAIAGQINFDDVPEPDDDNWTEFYQSACCPAGTDQPEFSPEEMEQLMCIVRSLPDDKLPTNDMGLEFRQHAYLQERYAALNRTAAQKKIKHRFAYMLKMIKSDAGLQ